RGRDDAVLIGAQAVNAYTEPSRMTEDVDLVAVGTELLAEELRIHLGQRLDITVSVRRDGGNFRIDQLRKPKSRHLVDVRHSDALPPAQRVAELLVVMPAALLAGKVMVYHQRSQQPRGGTDRRDIALLLLTFPELKTGTGPVRDALLAAGANEA